MICPNLSNPQIRQEFNELKSILGEDLAYLMWDRNNGYHLDKTNEGKPSKLFNDLLGLSKREQAILVKSKTLSNSFKQWYSGQLDENNEPKLELEDSNVVFKSNGTSMIVYSGGYQLGDSLLERESIKEGNRQQTKIYGSMSEQIMANFAQYFPMYDYYNDEQRRIVADMVEQGKLQLTCNF